MYPIMLLLLIPVDEIFQAREHQRSNEWYALKDKGKRIKDKGKRIKYSLIILLWLHLFRSENLRRQEPAATIPAY